MAITSISGLETRAKQLEPYRRLLEAEMRASTGQNIAVTIDSLKSPKDPVVFTVTNMGRNIAHFMPGDGQAYISGILAEEGVCRALKSVFGLHGYTTSTTYIEDASFQLAHVEPPTRLNHYLFP